MIKKKLRVKNRLGVHARPAGDIVDITSRSASEIIMSFDNTKANAKSILNVMMLAIPPEAEVEVEINGEDEKETMVALEKLFNDRFNEDEREC